MTLDTVQYHYRIHGDQARPRPRGRTSSPSKSPWSAATRVWADHIEVVMEELWRQQAELHYFTAAAMAGPTHSASDGRRVVRSGARAVSGSIALATCRTRSPRSWPRPSRADQVARRDVSPPRQRRTAAHAPGSAATHVLLHISDGEPGAVIAPKAASRRAATARRCAGTHPLASPRRARRTSPARGRTSPSPRGCGRTCPRRRSRR